MCVFSKPIRLPVPTTDGISRNIFGDDLHRETVRTQRH
jgi:hypothetical protein